MAVGNSDVRNVTPDARHDVVSAGDSMTNVLVTAIAQTTERALKPEELHRGPISGRWTSLCRLGVQNVERATLLDDLPLNIRHGSTIERICVSLV